MPYGILLFYLNEPFFVQEFFFAYEEFQFSSFLSQKRDQQKKILLRAKSVDNAIKFTGIAEANV